MVDAIVEALRSRRIEVLRDVKDILPLEEWRKRLESLILQSDVFVFCISRNSAMSEVCRWEAEVAHDFGKRIAPLAIEQLSEIELPTFISKLNYLTIDTNALSPEIVDQIVDDLGRNIDWVREHTRIVELASSWLSSGKSSSRLLRGKDIEAAERWRATRPANAPLITTLQQSYIETSRSNSRLRFGMIAGGVLLLLVSTAIGGYRWIDSAKLRAEEAVHLAVRAINDAGGSAEKQQSGFVVRFPIEPSNFNDLVRHIELLQPLVELDLQKSGVTDSNIAFLDRFRDLKELDLRENRVTDAGLVALVNLEKLESLKLDLTDVTDQGLKNLFKMESLRRLEISATSITGAGLSHLGENARLRALVADRSAFLAKHLNLLKSAASLTLLSLEGVNFRDEDFHLITRFSNLRSLYLDANPIKGHSLDDISQLRLNFLGLSYTDLDELGFRKLGTLALVRDVGLKVTNLNDQSFQNLCQMNLNVIRIPGTAVTDAGIACAARLADVTAVYMGDTRITTSGLKFLQNLKKVEELFFPSTRIGDDAVDTLLQMPNLKRIWVFRSLMTQQGIARLKSLRPNLVVKTSSDVAGDS